MTGPRARLPTAGASFAAHSKRKRWRARIWINGRDRQLGYFDTQEEARRAHADAARHLGLKLKSEERPACES
jgi:AP2 domain